MPITEYLERNAAQWPDDVALIEINPNSDKKRSDNWAEFALVEQDASGTYSTLTAKPISLQIYSWPTESVGATKSLFC